MWACGIGRPSTHYCLHSIPFTMSTGKACMLQGPCRFCACRRYNPWKRSHLICVRIVLWLENTARHFYKCPVSTSLSSVLREFQLVSGNCCRSGLLIILISLEWSGTAVPVAGNRVNYFLLPALWQHSPREEGKWGPLFYLLCDSTVPGMRVNGDLCFTFSVTAQPQRRG